MSHRDLRDMLGDDVPEEELARLGRVDSLLRSVPGPPAQVPQSLTDRVRRVPAPARLWTRRRALAGLALAAALAALFFGVGRWTSGGGDELATRMTVSLARTEAAPAGAWGVLRLGNRDAATGNWELELDVGGLPKLPQGSYYALWLEKDGEWAATCGSFNVGAEPQTVVRLSAAYRLDEYDTWKVSAIDPDEPLQSRDPQPVLQAPIT